MLKRGCISLGSAIGRNFKSGTTATKSSVVAKKFGSNAVPVKSLGRATESLRSATPSRPSLLANNLGKLRFDDSKAGLERVDKEHVERVIQEASKGSAFLKKEQRREVARRVKVEALLDQAEQFDRLSQGELQKIKSKVDTLVSELETTRDMRRRYIHIDMDMFYAAVEEKKNPKLRSVPFGVGSRQMLSTTNYIARQYGVRSGMPGFIGTKLCPDLQIVPLDFVAYKKEGALVHSIAARYDPDFVWLGLDELTMDVTKYLEEYPDLSAMEIATDFREEVFKKTRLTCSAGVAPSSALAKIASNVKKPNGQHEIILLSREDTLNYVKKIPLRQIPGIGDAQELALNALGVKTCGDLLAKKYLLCYLFKEKTFLHYLTVGLGLMSAHSHRPHDLRQSIGKEVSFSEPLKSEQALTKLFRQLLEKCHAQCVRENARAGRMLMVLKSREYDTQQYSLTLSQPSNDLKLWLDAAKRLMAPHLENYDDYRLVGVRMQKLTYGSGHQPSEERRDVYDDNREVGERYDPRAKKSSSGSSPMKGPAGAARSKSAKKVGSKRGW